MPRRGGPGGHEGKGQDQEEGGEEEAEGIFAFDSAAARQAFLRQWKETTQRGAMLIVYDETWATVKNSIHDDACAMATNGAPRDQATTLASRCQATTSKPSFRATKRERERVAPARCTCKRNACVPEERGRAGDWEEEREGEMRDEREGRRRECVWERARKGEEQRALSGPVAQNGNASQAALGRRGSCRGERAKPYGMTARMWVQVNSSMHAQLAIKEKARQDTDAELQRIQRKMARLEKEVQTAMECPVCLEMCGSGSVALIPCGHIFCNGIGCSATTCAPACDRALCPLCQQAVEKKQQLFGALANVQSALAGAAAGPGAH